MWPRLVFAAVAALAAMSTMTRAADPVADPRAYCDRLVGLLAEDDIDELSKGIFAQSSSAAVEAQVKAAVGTLAALPSKIGNVRSHEHAGEWVIGSAYARHYYVLIYEHSPFFVKCSMFKPGPHWLISDFIGNSDPYKIGFTQ